MRASQFTYCRGTLAAGRVSPENKKSSRATTKAAREDFYFLSHVYFPRRRALCYADRG
jgi:hypothetical protein